MGEGKGWVLSHSFCFLICVFVFCSLMSCLFFNRVQHDSCCVCFFVYYWFSLSLVPFTKSSWATEIVVSVM